MKKISPFAYGLKASLIFTAVSIAMLLIYFITGLDTSPMWVGIINFIVTVLMLVYVTSSYRKTMGGYMKIGQCVGMITTAGAVSSILNYLFNLVYVNYIDTHYLEKSLQQAQKMMASMGGMNDEMMDVMRTQLEAQMSFSMTTLGIALITSVIIYAIAGLILGAVFRKKDPYTIK